ncbi:MAG TPA: ornithine cyclodeaminase family protein [Pirellulaceae bacterium]|nr:ornithine cyclodeaminase family protein [Planctomycetales bacterium]MCB9937207.1 ornithine cyclodeaminase family protein [Planctomycetaceae bacterium]HRX77845.1 ornithine cyclodeaminase family protein [Pirellulaceae bacterium]
MPVLHLTESDVDQLLDMPTTIAVVEEAFRQLAAGRADNVPRHRAHAKGIVLHSMSAAADYLGLVGWKQYTTTSAGAKFHVGVYDQATGNLLALIEADRLGQMRTGAVTGIAARVLANVGSEEVGLFGSGWQAESQLEAVASTCPIRQAFVYSRDVARRTAFAAKMTERLGIEVVAVADPREAVESLPVVITATASRVPVFDGNWLSSGALVCAIGSNWKQKAEIDVTTIRRSSLIVCDSVECCQYEAGDFRAAIESGDFTWESARGLSSVLTDESMGRNSHDDIIIFKSVGMAIEDVAVAGKLVALAKQRGIGTTLPI